MKAKAKSHPQTEENSKRSGLQSKDLGREGTLNDPLEDRIRFEP